MISFRTRNIKLYCENETLKIDATVTLLPVAKANFLS